MLDLFRAKKFARIALAILLIGIANARAVAAEVTLVAFSARGDTSAIKIVWTTASERKNWGFNLERSTDQKTWEHLGAQPSVKSQSPCIQNVMGATYEFTDLGRAPGVRYFYRLQTIGQPCGDADRYHDEIISAQVIAPTATPTVTRAASPTATAPIIVSPIPSATRSVAPMLTPTRALPSATATSTKIAIAQIRATSTRALAATPTASSSPMLAHRIATEESDAPADDAIPTQSQNNVARDWRRAGILGAAMLFGAGTLIVGALALIAYLRLRE